MASTAATHSAKMVRRSATGTNQLKKPSTSETSLGGTRGREAMSISGRNEKSAAIRETPPEIRADTMLPSITYRLPRDRR